MPERPFTRRHAALALEAIPADLRGLRNRLEGQTFALWGILVAAIHVTVALVGLLVDAGHLPSWPPWGAWLWLPWTSAGAATTWAMWRAAGLGRMRGGAGWAHLALWGLLLTASWTVLGLVGGANELVQSTLAYGSTAVVLGAVNVPGVSPKGRWVLLGGGALLVGAALVQVALGAGYATATVAGAAVTVVAFVGGGVAQTLSG